MAQLTGIEIYNRGIIKGTEINDIDTENQIQQQGFDLRLDSVRRVDGLGVVRAKGKTITPSYYTVLPTCYDEYDKPLFELEPGYYEIDFMESCELGNNVVMQILSRSSLIRCGAQVRAGQFDAGFHTDQMGAFLEVILPISIEHGARVAQAIVHESNIVDDEYMYDGQWQGDKQRLK